MSKDSGTSEARKCDQARRGFLERLGRAVATATAAVPALATPAWGGATFLEVFGDFFNKQYKKMSREEIDSALAKIERRVQDQYGVEINCVDTPPREKVVFGYAINISTCRGYRDCVHACVKENNLGRNSQVEYIRVLQMDQGTQDLEKSDHYYDPETVPVEGKYYLPVQCMQCDNPPCVKACPVEATWMEPDGIVVIDYDWCIGCRYCMSACPYSARHFNWTEPELPSDEINGDTHYLGNRPRPRGVVEKCHFCIQRTRDGGQPAC
ncbi:MAG: 4Fe-4S dicluster domain-containing protein, partial [Gammaproteobacteria bacterium]|nr:4Fe-4S dicluster domain-containing protein [Gammaproteobacteria bacterium]